MNTPYQTLRPAASMVRWAVVLLSIVLGSLAHAAEEAKVPFRIGRDDATVTLKAFMQQSGKEIMYPVAAVKGTRTNPVNGEFTPQEALEQMLAGTELAATKTKSGVLAVTRVSDPNVNRAIAEGSDRPEGKSNLVEHAEGEKVIKLDTFEVMGSKLLNMDIPRDRDGPRPYVVFQRDAIERSGAQSLDEFFKQRLPMNTTHLSGNMDVSSTAGAANSAINLRGLGTTQTLILVDGRRIPSVNASGTQVQGDVNGIPLFAIERIEVLPAAAGAIYGGGATGGVVNIILRRDYAGADFKLSYENSFETDTARRRVDLGVGLNSTNGKTNVLLNASWSDGNALLSQDLPELRQRGMAAILENNPSFFFAASAPPTGYGTTANIRSANGSNLVLKPVAPGIPGVPLNSPITFAPVGYAGAQSDQGAALVANAGQYNLNLLTGLPGSRGTQRALAYPETYSLGAAIRHQFSAKLQAYVDMTRSESKFVAPEALWINAASNLPASSPTNPFTTAIVVRGPFAVSDITAPEYTNFMVTEHSSRLTAGLLVELPFDWKASLDLTWGRSGHWFSAPSTLSAAGVAAFNTGVLDALRDSVANPLALAGTGYLSEPGQSLRRTHTTLLNPSVRIGGPLYRLRAGDLTMSGLIDYRSEELDETQTRSGASILTGGARRQQTTSAYIEAVVPVVSEGMQIPFVQKLDLTASARAERYVTDGSNTVFSSVGAVPPANTLSRNSVQEFDPSVTLSYQPTSRIKLRTSYGTGFLPPSPNQLTQSVNNNAVGGPQDPRRGGETLGVWQLTSGGNPDLRPEHSESWSGGIVLTSSMVRGFRASVDYTRTKKRDNIASFPGGQQAIVNNEALLPGRVTRGPVPPNDPYGVGPITAINASLFNIARTDIEAFDFQLDYRIEMGQAGTLELFAAATRTLHYKTQIFTDQPVVENVGLVASLGTGSNPLKFKGNGGLTWTKNQWLIGWNFRYLDSYTLTNATAVANQGTAKVPSQHYHDVFIRYKVKARDSGLLSRGLLGDTEWRLGVLNVFDTQPPLDLINTLNQIFYSRYGGDPRGSVYQLSVSKAL